MADKPQNEIRYCRHCGDELTSWKSPYCSDQCYELGPSDNSPMPDKPALEPVSTEPAEESKASAWKQCVVCDKPLDAKHHKCCSMACWQTANPEKANESSAASGPQPVSTEPREPVIATVPNQTVSKRGILGEGAPTKCTPEIIEAVVRDRCRGFSLEQSCAYNGCSHDQWTEWEKRPE